MLNSQRPTQRRLFLKTGLLGVISVSVPQLITASPTHISIPKVNKEVFHRYPSIDDEIVAEVVGASHFNLERVMQLVNKRPELSRATWDWAFGDWETALGAASHTGRRDIAEFLIEKGARPDLFTFAMLGHNKAVKSMIEASPGIQRIQGPHGINLLQHAEAGLRTAKSEKQKEQCRQLIDYLQSLGDADISLSPGNMSKEEKEKYLGDYRYGPGDYDGVSVKLIMRDMLSLGKLGKSGGALYPLDDGSFAYNDTTSVRISFQLKDDKVTGLTIHEPDLVLRANKV